MIQTTQRLELILNGLGHLIDHAFRTSARITHRDRHGRDIDIRQQIDRHNTIREQTQHDGEQQDHRNNYGLPDRRVGDDHPV